MQVTTAAMSSSFIVCAKGGSHTAGCYLLFGVDSYR